MFYINYWVFQYTTTVYKTVIEDFKSRKIIQWEVNKHKDKIKIGDLAIIYIGGKNAKAIYGIARITSDLYLIQEKNKHYVKIEIVEDWSDSPISLSTAKKEIPTLKIGICGTNFSSNEDEYHKLFYTL